MLRSYFIASTISILSIGAAHAADSKSYECGCQVVVVCGADSCSPGDTAFCAGTKVTLSSQPPSIKVCNGSTCTEGPADAAGSSDGRLVLNNELRVNGPDVNPSRVFAQLDTSYEIGSMLTTDEGGPAVYTLICRLPGEPAPDAPQ